MTVMEDGDQPQETGESHTLIPYKFELHQTEKVSELAQGVDTVLGIIVAFTTEISDSVAMRNERMKKVAAEIAENVELMKRTTELISTSVSNCEASVNKATQLVTTMSEDRTVIKKSMENIETSAQSLAQLTRSLLHVALVTCVIGIPIVGYIGLEARQMSAELKKNGKGIEGINKSLTRLIERDDTTIQLDARELDAQPPEHNSLSN